MIVVGLVLFAAAAVLVGLALMEAFFRAQPDAGGTPPARPGIPDVAFDLGLPERIRRAGREAELSPRSLLAAKALAAVAGLCLGLIVGPAAPSRLAPLLLVGLGLLGFLTPDLLLERTARRRHRQIVAALPDALDLLAVSVASGRSLGEALLELSEGGRGALRREFAAAGGDMAWGAGQAAALAALKARVGGREVASLCATLERSRRLGSPLADQLRRQASALRQEQRREIQERAARAAPKIQLVIALVLVPSVLLLMIAALVANADTLLGVGIATFTPNG